MFLSTHKTKGTHGNEQGMLNFCSSSFFLQCFLVAAGGWWEFAQCTIEVGGLPPPTSQNNMDSWWHHWNSCRKVSGDAVNVMLTGAIMTVSRYIEMIFIQNIETLPFVVTNFLCPWISNLQTLPAGYGAVQGETWGIALGGSGSSNLGGV